MIRSSSLLFSILGIILHVPVTKVKRKKLEGGQQGSPLGSPPPETPTGGEASKQDG